ncbi:MAG: hypothetical protein CVU84_12055 [Firmicutes bacterium HGW-Firmicutes-1]|jgi:CheY-like chemotaxis protein|nr:MAG: hypothetical protein CVU84_12055 [Firmicutes bacterium HGW-Firmicutes-1]
MSHETKPIPNGNEMQSIKKTRVLVLEDNKINQMLAVEMLGMLGIHDVHVVENGLEGLEKAQENEYDLIVTDIKMPKMDGIEFAQNIREMDRYCNTPIIALTANVREDQIQSYYKVGINNCIMKPVDIVEFGKTLKKYLK